jgi:DNA invertase Pin-like site-specific DNA recombinase
MSTWPGSDQAGDQPTPPKRAAQYVRMSTEHQQYSTENQEAAIRSYAKARNLVIVRTYADEGKSGLRVEGRNALKQLINDVETGRADFEAILVYDVSRWGRFQDADESAYYEYICRRADIAVHYCAEQFENDGSPVATIVKGVKRAMAGEYSRELSAKVFAGQCRLIELGYRQGGLAGFGLRRRLIDQHGEPKGLLGRGEQKSLQTDRVVLVPGPPEETAIVREIYRLFVDEGRLEREIADILNARGCLTDLGRPWTRGTVHQVLTNEKYIGNNLYNRISFKLKKKRVANPPDMWIRADGVFEAIVDPGVFYTAQGMLRERYRRLSDADMLARLKALVERHGCLSGIMIDETESMPSSAAYRSRFGSLLRAYQLIGYTPARDYRYLAINRHLRHLHAETVRGVIGEIEGLGGAVEQDAETDLLTINQEFTTSLVLARCRSTDAGSLRWLIRFDASLCPDITLAVRMAADNQSVLDYYLLPQLDLGPARLRLAHDNGLGLDCFRFATLDYFFGMAERARLPVAA